MELKEKHILEIQGSLKKIRREARNIEEVLEIVGIKIPAIKVPQWFRQRGKVFLGIYNFNKEHIVSRKEFHAIAKNAGYSMYGIGGFFTGDNLVEVSGGRIALTDAGIDRLVEFGYVKAVKE